MFLDTALPKKVRLQELLKSPTQSDVKIAVRQLPEESAHAEEEVKRLLRDVKKTGEVNIVLDCATERIQSVLKAAQQASSGTSPDLNPFTRSSKRVCLNLNFLPKVLPGPCQSAKIEKSQDEFTQLSYLSFAQT